MPSVSRPDGPVRILLVDADVVWRRDVVRGLATQGVEVRTAADLGRALVEIATERPDAVVVDAGLAEGAGPEPLRGLAEAGGRPPVPVLALGRRDDEATVERAFDAGATDFLRRSAQWKLLAERIVQLVGAARLHTELASSRQRLDRAQGLAQATVRRVRELAQRDPLTGMLNRRGFLAAVQARLDADPGDETRPAALLILDLDRFQRLNDALGAEAGDETLRQVGQRLQGAFRNLPAVVFGRLAADEFALFFPSLPSDAAAERAAQIAIAELSRPMRCGGLDFVPRASIGIASRPDAAADATSAAEAMLARAGQAMASAKAQGGHRWRRFEAELGQTDRVRFDLEAALHGAIERDELVLHYQPIVDPRSRRVAGVEALMRWRRDDRLMSPADFIPIAEETGLIQPMGDWAIGEALQQVRRWREAGVPVGTVSVNIHVRHLERAGFVEDVRDAIEASGLEASALELELTETGVMRDVAHALETLRDLKRLGVRLALDDFGTGWSSLAYLTQLPLDTLKIDRSFVDSLGGNGQSRAVVRSITALAQALGLATVAEGVETRAQLDSLRALGCDEVQGYYFARPMPARDLPAWWGAFDGRPAGSGRGGRGAGLAA
ncbi:MAG: EAL domain-containing protein [Burkholderiales bacterium]